jgi:hypothetical protein
MTVRATSGRIRRLGAAAALAFAAILASGEAMACKCVPAPPFASTTLKTPPKDKLVFIGRVQSRKPGHESSPGETVFSVLKPISGEAGQTLVMRGSMATSCDFPFDVSKVYLVVGKRLPGGELSTFKCDMPIQNVRQSALLAAASR